MDGLTPRMRKLLDFLNGYIVENGFSPSFDEMKDALGLRSKSGVHRLVLSLEERGWVTRLPHRARTLTVNKSEQARTGIFHVQ